MVATRREDVHTADFIAEDTLEGTHRDTAGKIAQRILAKSADASTDASTQTSALGSHRASTRDTTPCVSHLISREQLKSLAHWAYQFTPSVCLHWPLHGQSAGLLLEVAPSLSLFGGVSAMLQRIETGLNDLGLACRPGVSVTATSAWWLSQCTSTPVTHASAPVTHINEVTSLSAILPALPIQVLDSAYPHLLTLERCGIHHIRQMLQLPRSGLSRRFGAALVRELDCGFARHAELHTWIQPPPVFDVRQEMPFHTLQLQGVLNVAATLLTSLQHWLQGQWAATRTVRFTFHHGRSNRHADHANTTVRWVRAAQPTQMAEAWRQLLQDELIRQPLLAEACDISLRADALEPVQTQTDTLFPGPQEQQQAWSTLLGRLHARLGFDSLQTPVATPDPRPEYAHRMQTHIMGAQENATKARAKTNGKISAPLPARSALLQSTLRLPRPLWFLPKPERLPLQNNRPVQKGLLSFLAGPERIEFGWWDSPATRRDYFIAQDSDQRQLWVYRERSEQGGSNRWYLHGLFG